MNAPLVSCIVPVFNGQRYLAEALDSVLRQTHRPLDVVVVNDGSSDRTREVIAAYGARVRCVEQPHAGLAAARNRGIAAAAGDLIAFLDADDLWLPEKIARQVDRLRARAEAEANVTYIQNFWADEDGSRTDPLAGPSLEPLPGYCSPAMLARREVFARVGPYDPALRTGACRDWFIRARERRVVFDVLDEVLVRRRLHAMNMSRERQKREDYTQLVKRHLDRRRGRTE
jgi:glycosyltransferase involved in cell wall biosynthesis